MSLQSYVARLADLLRSRQDIAIEDIQLVFATAGAVLQARVSFYDGSVLSIVEEIEGTGLRDIRRLVYKFHYQHADGTLVFRYDDSPHYRHLTSFPHHKHIGNSVIEAEPPDLVDVLREIDALIYPDTSA